ncbi:hypothetical protein BpHYR1_005630, partial [Brachionus plicatilis]
MDEPRETDDYPTNMGNILETSVNETSVTVLNMRETEPQIPVPPKQMINASNNEIRQTSNSNIPL